jgi:LuxR family transcriptional regulator, maltose regulon positive regulatory protein
MAFAKTTPPTLAAPVARPRLFRRLDRAGRRPVTWVWAPPGSGKTTLVASYLVARRRRALWYQVDEGDGDVATFFYYLGLAAPRRRRPLPLLTAEYRQGLPVFARRFFRELYSRLAAPVAIVLDNYQDAPADSQLHEVMREALEEIPQGVRLIVISRTEPPAALARSLAHGVIDAVPWDDLRFTLAEAQALVRTRAPGRWSGAMLRTLHERTEGWCAGLIVLLDQLRAGSGELPASGKPPRVLFDYFAGEIFKTMDADVQDVLQRTAFLPRVTAAMAEALSGNPAAGEALARLYERHYFTNKHAGTPPTYEYHPLFREFLLARAAETYSRQTQAEIRAAAAELLDEAGQVEAAASLMREAGDWHGFAVLIQRYAQRLVAQGRARTLEEWLGSVPPPIFDEQPWLLFWRGMAWMAWRHADCQRTLEEAFVRFRERRDHIGMHLAWAARIFALMSEGNVLAMDRWLTVLDEILLDAPGFPTKGVETRVATGMLVAITWRRPRHPDAERWAARAIELGRSHPDVATKAMAVVTWMLYQLEVGQLARASVVIDEMRTVIRGRDVSPVSVVNASMPIVWYEAFTAQASYRETVTRMLDLARSTGMFYTARHIILCGGVVGALSDGDLETAEAWQRELEVDVHTLGPMFRFWHHRAIVWAALIRRDVARASSYQAEMLRLAEQLGAPLDLAVAQLTSAQIFHARGEADGARAAVERALDIGREIRSTYVEFMARLVEAEVALDGGREADGLQALATALAFGREWGYVNSHVWIPAAMARLCARALQEGIEVEYARMLVARRRLVPETPPVEAEAWPWAVKIFTLGRFEVLRDGEPVRFARKVQRRPLALLKVLIALGGRGVREDRVMDALWPESAGDAARMALSTAVHRLRKLLGHEAAVLRQDGLLSLDSRLCWVDVWAVDRFLDHAGAAASPEAALRKAIDLCRGGFLEGEEAELPQAVALADALRRRLLRQVARQARHWESSDAQRAADWYEEALRFDPCAEDVARALMTIYQRLGRPAAATAVYERCRAALATHVGRAPSPETERVLRAIR